MRKIQLLRKAIISICMLLGSLVWAQAQNGTIKGTVRDERGPLVGASVTIQGKSTGTTTNDNGDYEFKINETRDFLSIKTSSVKGFQFYGGKLIFEYGFLKLLV